MCRTTYAAGLFGCTHKWVFFALALFDLVSLIVFGCAQDTEDMPMVLSNNFVLREFAPATGMNRDVANPIYEEGPLSYPPRSHTREMYREGEGSKHGVRMSRNCLRSPS